MSALRQCILSPFVALVMLFRELRFELDDLIRFKSLSLMESERYWRVVFAQVILVAFLGGGLGAILPLLGFLGFIDSNIVNGIVIIIAIIVLIGGFVLFALNVRITAKRLKTLHKELIEESAHSIDSNLADSEPSYFSHFGGFVLFALNVRITAKRLKTLHKELIEESAHSIDSNLADSEPSYFSHFVIRFITPKYFYISLVICVGCLWSALAGEINEWEKIATIFFAVVGAFIGLFYSIILLPNLTKVLDIRQFSLDCKTMLLSIGLISAGFLLIGFSPIIKFITYEDSVCFLYMFYGGMGLVLLGLWQYSGTYMKIWLFIAAYGVLTYMITALDSVCFLYMFYGGMGLVLLGLWQYSGTYMKIWLFIAAYGVLTYMITALSVYPFLYMFYGGMGLVLLGLWQYSGTYMKIWLFIAAYGVLTYMITALSVYPYRFADIEKEVTIIPAMLCFLPLLIWHIRQKAFVGVLGIN